MIPPIARTISDLIGAHHSFLVVTHVDPDGDGIGSGLALCRALRGLGKTARLRLPQGVPPKYSFLPGADTIEREGGPEPVAFVLDCDGAQRLGQAEETVRQCPVVVVIDHHQDTPAFGAVNWLDPTCPAVGLQIHGLLQALGTPLTRELAICLYCAIGTDTGFFRYANTTPEVLRVAAELLEAGADPKAIAEATLDRYPAPFCRLAGRALASVTVRLDGLAAVAVLSTDDFECAGTNETEGVIDFLRVISGVEVLVLLREQEKGWRVSLRSLGGTNVGAAARKLGGGGHALAAGCIVRGAAEEAWAALEEALREVRQGAGRDGA